MVTKVESNQWLDECNPSTWLLEEYKLLSAHYFHEDTAFKKTITMFASLNVGLLGFLNSNLVEIESESLIYIPIIGVVLCFSWITSMVRVREFRNYLERRIQSIEETLDKHWSDKEIDLLHIRQLKRWNTNNKQVSLFNFPITVPYQLFRNIPASISYFVLPTVFITVWGSILANLIQ